MKLKIERDTLLELVKLAGHASESSGTLPVLGTVLLQADGKQLTVKGTDLDRALAVSCEACEIQADGAIALPAKRLEKLVKLQDGSLTIEQVKDKDRVTIQGTGARYELAGMAAEEFPAFKGEKRKPLEFNCDEFRQVLLNVAPAISTDGTKYVLCGVFLEARTDEVRLVATDGHRVHYDAIVYSKPPAPSGILPAPTVAFLAKHLPDVDSELTVKMGKGSAAFTWKAAAGKVTYESKLIEGAYPGYEKVISTERQGELESVVAELEHAVEKAAIMTADTERRVVIQVDKKATIVATSSTVGTAEVDVKGAVLKGTWPAEGFGINPQYLAEALGGVVALKCPLALVSKGTAILVTDGRYTAFLLGMTVNS